MNKLTITPSNMKIRTRIMLLYLLLSAILLAILMPVVNFLVVHALQNGLVSDISTSMENAAACLYEEDEQAKFDESMITMNSVASGVYIRVTDEGGNILYQSMEADLVYEWIQEDDSRAETAEDWISDSMTAEIAGETITIEAVGSYFLAKRAMQPIRRITDTVRSISSKAWSGRTHDIQSRDEVGELAETFNEMMDELETSYERERQFTSDASHELRTPITVIRACTEEALEAEDAEVSRENLLTIQNETEKMTRMITQLLFLSRGYEGRLNFDPEEISLYDMAASVSEELAAEAKKKAITIHNRVPEETVLTADQSLFTNLLVNLIGNAVKYGKEGGNVWIDAKTEGDDLFLTVADDGIGISEEDLPHIFDRFYRADAARDRSGSGLGLSICKWIVQMHGGTIRAESKAVEGSSFCVQMPVCPGSRRGDSQLQSASDEEVMNLSKQLTEQNRETYEVLAR